MRNQPDVRRMDVGKAILAGLFLFGLFVIAYNWWLWMGVILLVLGGVYIKRPTTRFVNALFLSFLISFSLFQGLNIWMADTDLPKEWNIIFNRLSLAIIIISLYITHLLYRQPFSFFHRKPDWDAHLRLPGHAVPIFHFWLIGLLVNCSVYLPFIIMQGAEEVKSLFLLALLFSLVNAVFEEFIWRGPLFASLIRHASVPYAFVVTSIGFGLLHLAIGIPLALSLLFSFAGLFYGLVVHKTGSIYPAVVFHFVLNMGMVLSGWIM